MYSSKDYEKDLKKVKDKEGLKALYKELQSCNSGHIINCNKSQKDRLNKKRKETEKRIQKFLLDQKSISKIDSKNERSENK